jgi:RecA/RadA recombinase
MLTPEQMGTFMFHRFYTGVIDMDLVFRPTIGKRHCFIGEESKGKTLLLHILEGAANRTCRRCFKPIIPWINDDTGEINSSCKCGKNDPLVVIHIDIEDSFDPWWAKAWGVNVGEDTQEKEGYKFRKNENSTLFVVTPHDHEATFLFAEDAVKSGAADFVGIDSIALVVPKEDVERKGIIVGVEDGRVGSRARIVGQGLARLLRAQNHAKNIFGARPTVVWTNQYYAGPTQNPKQDPRRQAGGLKQRYISDLTLRLKSATLDTQGSKLAKIGAKHIDIVFDTGKCKAAGTPGGGGRFRAYLDETITKYGPKTAGQTDEHDRLLIYLKDLGLFEEKGDHYSCLGRKFKKVKDLVTFLGRRDIGYLARYFIFSRLLPVSARAYLKREDYDYSPWGHDIAFESIKEDGEDNVPSPSGRQGRAEAVEEMGEEAPDWSPFESEESQEGEST